MNQPISMDPTISNEIIEKLWKLNRNFCSSDYDDSLEILKGYLPFKIYEYRNSYQGWEIPPKWDLIRGVIKFENKVIFEVDHPLKIIGLSQPFQGSVSLEELKNHLHYDHRDSESIPYHFRQHYRPWERDWGFCVPKKFYDNLETGTYEVEILTNESKGYLKIAEYIKQGEHPNGFAFVAHLDHPGMANDDLAGVAVGVEAFKSLISKKTKFSYRLVLVQEVIGSTYYLGNNTEAPQNILESCFLEMLGTKTPLSLQRSFKGDSLLENKLNEILSEKNDFTEGPFRSIVGNDEIVWESYQIPMSSLTRFPYPEYHSDKDNPEIISRDSLNESVKVIMKLIEGLDKCTLMSRKFKGVYSLSNPAYNLYVDPGQLAFGNALEEDKKSFRLLMDLIPIFPKEIFVEVIAKKVDLPLETILSYLKKWEEKGLIDLI